MESHLTLKERLVQHGIVSTEEIERVARLQEEHPAQLAQLVVELGFISEDDLLPILGEHLGIFLRWQEDL